MAQVSNASPGHVTWPDADHLIVGQDGHQVGDTIPSGFGAAYIYSTSDVIATHGSGRTTREAAIVSAVYPNPAASQASIEVTVHERVSVEISVFDMLGRRVSSVLSGLVSNGRQVTVLHEGNLDAGVSHRFLVEAHGLPAGHYFVLIRGETLRLSHVATRAK